ncbi:MAG TPA: ribose-5-phosphate isomerase RpiA [Candidatus Binatia bacterium]|nr:ribose-5-phosphate isomerase RpiA [Candidatus Binatia bacterium]
MQASEKQRAAEAAAGWVRDGTTIGLGSGTTVELVVRALAERVRTGLCVRAVPASERTAALARAGGIGVVGFEEVERLDLAIDGADEVDPAFAMIKGGGAALLREKVVASAAETIVIAVDSTKTVERLGRFPLPVETVPFAWPHVARLIARLGARVVRRLAANGAPVVTDNGNVVLDCAFGAIPDPAHLERELKAIAGVAEVGLFVDLCDVLLVGVGDGVTVRRREDRPPYGPRVPR